MTLRALSIAVLATLGLSACSSDSDSVKQPSYQLFHFDNAYLNTAIDSVATCPETAQYLGVSTHRNGIRFKAQFTLLETPYGSEARIEGFNELYADLPGTYRVRAQYAPLEPYQDNDGTIDEVYEFEVHPSMAYAIAQSDSPAKLNEGTVSLACDNHTDESLQPLTIDENITFAPMGTSRGVGYGGIDARRPIILQDLERATSGWPMIYSQAEQPMAVTMRDVTGCAATGGGIGDITVERSELESCGLWFTSTGHLKVIDSKLSSPFNAAQDYESVMITGSDVTVGLLRVKGDLHISGSNLRKEPQSDAIHISHRAYEPAQLAGNWWGAGDGSTMEGSEVESHLNTQVQPYLYPLADKPYFE
ncbi:hypothetical protein [Ferrimonas marina]|uniref:Lipoprotein n=1 Tax=Ferrimonas marina TaxID=299255 RepID=A0A1M5VAH8_9GAMM|nr:hypothetical protein [Ferrimonas marina]SHH72225.1 hypothetical protein SAMN02745129_2675 [Ferrimonas marina]